MNLVFEDTDQFTNFLNCSDVNLSGIKRFGPSPMAVTLMHRTQLVRHYSMKNKPRPYIIATGVNHHPNDWTGSPLAYNNTRNTAFSYLHKKQLNDLQSGKAMLLFDQSLEGYQTPWLWEYFHNECDHYGVNPNAIIYTSGNMLGEQQYTEWANLNNKIDRITVIPYTHFEADIFNNATWNGLSVTVDDHLNYKTEHDIKSYNCLQKRLRNHRIWFFTKLFEAGILEHGLVSMNKFSSEAFMEGRTLPVDLIDRANTVLPLLVHGKNNNEKDDNYYINRIQDQVFLDSWVSVISEAGFPDSHGQLFLSEKIFKPIVCHHPFIIVGDRGSLKELQKMGYKTFEGFIDESYDDLPTFERYDAIIESIKKIIAIPDKVRWYESMRSILEHNYRVLSKNAQQVNPAYIKLEKKYNEYFKLGK